MVEIIPEEEDALISLHRTQVTAVLNHKVKVDGRLLRTKEVILLPGKNDSEVCRGNRKVSLMSQGLIRTELELDRQWAAQHVEEYFEKCFEENLPPFLRRLGYQGKFLHDLL